jgi:hypothetical protein
VRFLPALNHEAAHKWPSSPDLIGRPGIPALIAGHGFGANLAHAYLWLEPPRRCSTRFINVNLVEATNRFSHFQFIAGILPSSGTPASDETPWRTVRANSKENVMSGRVMVVLASAALAGSLLATDAQARGGHGGGGGGESAVDAPRLEKTAVTSELRFTRDVTPADRVKEEFAQFDPNEGKRGKHYSSTATVIR